MASITGMCSANTCINRLAAAEYPFGHFGIVFNNTNPDMQSEAIRVVGNSDRRNEIRRNLRDRQRTYDRRAIGFCG